MNFFKKKTIDPVSRYQPVSGGLSYNQLNLSFWFLQNRETIKKIGAYLLIAWCVLSVGYSGYFWLEYLIVGYSEDQHAYQESLLIAQQSYSEVHNLYQAQTPRIGRPQVLVSANDSYDFITEINNVNTDFIMRLIYSYSYVGGATLEKEVILLPGGRQIAVVLGHASNIYPANPVFKVVSVQYRRINAHLVSNPANFISERLRLNLSDLSYISQSGSASFVDQVSFSLFNDSAFSFYQLNGYALIYNQDVLVSVRPITLDRFLSNEKRVVDMRFLQSLGAVTNVEFLPLVNVFDLNVFMPPEA